MMKIMRAAAAVLGIWMLCAPVHAQGGPTTLQFSFSNPGARSMGFGGAFIGLADDATAAFANPAGLVQLAKAEVSLEGRRWSYDTPFTEGGRASGLPTGIGIDNVAGLRIGNSSDELTALSFVSFVYPVKRWSLAFYRHQLSKFEAESRTQGLFAEPAPGQVERNQDETALTELDIVTYGFSAGYRVSESFSLGFGIGYFDGAFLLATEEFLWDDDTFDAFFAPNSYLPERLVGVAELTIDDTDWGLLAGFRWQVSEQVSLGGVFRQGPRFDAVLTQTAGPQFDGAPPGSTMRAETPFEFPDVYGLGVAVRSRNDTFTFNFDWDRVEYSTILESLDPGLFDDIPVIDDADELHAGIEYVLLKTTPVVALRFGAWLDPDHRLRSVSTEVFDRAAFQGGDDEIHLAAGVGVALSQVQFDLGIDFSELVDTVSISAIYKF
jgi:long-subunit fatty acid transport protein